VVSNCYRLAFESYEDVVYSAEVWLEVPLPYELAIAAASLKSGTIAVSFNLPLAGGAKLELVDVAGRRVARHQLGYLEAGPHDVAITANRMPSGIYLLTLYQGNASVARKVVVAR